jgi:arginine repressor
VTDTQGRSVTGLNKSHFTVTEAGVARTITTFIELRDRDQKAVVHYQLEFESAREGAKVSVVLNAPRGLPPLTLTWK